MIALIDYGGGNVGSVLKAIQYLGGAAEVVDRPERLAAATKIILPGQGHFGAMMHALRARGLLEPLRRVVENSIGSRAADGWLQIDHQLPDVVQPRRAVGGSGMPRLRAVPTRTQPRCARFALRTLRAAQR